MPTEQEYQSLYDRIAALRETTANRLGPELIQNPQLADALTKQIDDLLQSVVDADSRVAPPPDKGLGQLIGLGPEAAADFGKTRLPRGVEPYDDTVTAERIVAVGDLYYLFQHEKIGVFRVVQKLQELFKAGTVRLSGGPGAFALYQFDRRRAALYQERSPVGVQADLRIRWCAGSHGLARQHRLSQAVLALRSPGHSVLA